MSREKQSMHILIDLYLTFAKVGSMMFGGGYAMLPILQREIVDNKKWATTDQLTDYYAVGQCTPGVIAVNTATFIGSNQAGIAGGVAATLGVVTVPAILILIIAAFLNGVMDSAIVAHAFSGIRACVTALIAAAGNFLAAPERLVRVWEVITSPVFLVVISGIAGLAIRSVQRSKKGGGKE